MFQKKIVGSVLSAVMAVNMTIVSPALGGLALHQPEPARSTPSRTTGLTSARHNQASRLTTQSSAGVTNYVNQAEQSKGAANRVKTPVKPTLPQDQYQMLVRIIHAEAGGEPLQGQVAVGAVLLNRIRSGKFPTSVTANVFKAGEFESVSNGYIWSQPTDSSYRAAQLAIQGWDPTNGAIYFYNPAKTSSRWIWSRPIVTKIGKHFFAV